MHHGQFATAISAHAPPPHTAFLAQHAAALAHHLQACRPRRDLELAVHLASARLRVWFGPRLCTTLLSTGAVAALGWLLT